MKKKKEGQKRKICFVITSFIHYARNFLVLEELKNRDDVELHIIIGGTALLPEYSSSHAQVKELLESEGYENIHEAHFNLEGDSKVVKAKGAGLAAVEFSLLFNEIAPDVVVVRGDRFEVLSAATTASFMNIPVAHIEGGDVSGTLDESVRHAITKLAHIHFSTNEPAKNRIIRMGENKKYVFNFGSPDVEVVQRVAGENNHIDLSRTGSGASIDTEKDFLMVMYHPVTSEADSMGLHTKNLLEVIHEMGIPTVWFWPNVDAGAEKISHAIRFFKDSNQSHNIRFMRNLPPVEFLPLLKKTKCLIGNSSSGIKECSYIGTPVVNIGSRQSNRLRADNVVDVKEDKELIRSAIEKQMKRGLCKSSDLYYAGNTSTKIAETLAVIDLYTQKNFAD